MRIKYKNSMEDIIAFNKYHCANSVTFQKQKKLATIYLPIIFFVLMILLFAVIQEIKIIVFGSLGLVIFTFFINHEYKKGIYKTTKRLYEEQDTNGIICEHILEINNENIMEKTDINEQKALWVSVQKIDTDNDYAYIYVSAIQAHIIPRKNVSEGNFEEFIEKARQYWQNQND